MALPDDMDVAELYATAESLIEDPRCESVWSALARRQDEFRKRWSDAPPVKDSNEWLRIEAVSLIGALLNGLEGIPRNELFSATERRERGNKIAKLASELGRELAWIDEKCGYDFDPFHDDMVQLASQIANIELARQRDSDELGPTGREWVNHVEKGWDDRSYGVLVGVEHVQSILIGLSKSAEKWASSKPPVVRFEDQNAGRLYFVRYMTKYFRERYGAPLREQIATLVQVRFNSELDAATISKLAP